MSTPMDSVAKIDQGFPRIQAPFINSDGTINQVWLQLLISLWNRTGLGPGASTADALAFATMQENRLAQPEPEATVLGLGAESASQVLGLASSLALDSLAFAQAPGAGNSRVGDSLESVLFDVPGSGGSTGNVTFPQVPVYAPAVTGETPGPVLLANLDGSCIMVHVSCVDNPCG